MRTISCEFLIETLESNHSSIILLGGEYLKDYMISYSLSGKDVSLLHLYDSYTKYNLTAILIVLILVIVLISVCTILMVRHERKSVKADTIKSELLRRQSFRKRSDALQ